MAASETVGNAKGTSYRAGGSRGTPRVAETPPGRRGRVPHGCGAPGGGYHPAMSAAPRPRWKVVLHEVISKAETPAGRRLPESRTEKRTETREVKGA